MTTCQRCNGEKTLPTLRLVGKHWLPIHDDPCPDCGGTGLKPEHICRFCGMVLQPDQTGAYCNDVCQHKALQSITIDNTRFGIKAVVEAPSGGWVYGENMSIEKKGYVVEIRIGVGGAVLTRIRKKGATIKAGVITVEKMK